MLSTTRSVAFSALIVMAAASPAGARSTNQPNELARMLGLGQPAQSSFAPAARYRACFTPDQDCEGLVVALIDRSTSTIAMQAYGFTSRPIGTALLSAHRRGVAVTLLIDKEARRDEHTQATALAAAGVTVAVDDRPAIAHNKVLLIDAGTPNPTVVTGSFNWTRAAQDKNAENLLVIEGDPSVTAAYASNFDNRRHQSTPWR